LSSVARSQAPTVQVEPSVFPQPISGTCPTCWLDAASTSALSLTVPALGQDLDDATLVVRLSDGSLHAIALGTLLASAAPYAFVLPSGWVVQAAYLSGFDSLHQYSTTEQIFVAR